MHKFTPKATSMARAQQCQEPTIYLLYNPNRSCYSPSSKALGAQTWVYKLLNNHRNGTSFAISCTNWQRLEHLQPCKTWTPIVSVCQEIEKENLMSSCKFFAITAIGTKSMREREKSVKFAYGGRPRSSSLHLLFGLIWSGTIFSILCTIGSLPAFPQTLFSGSNDLSWSTPGTYGAPLARIHHLHHFPRAHGSF